VAFVTEEFILTLTRPIGLTLVQTPLGVEISAISPPPHQCPSLSILRIHDKITAVSSSLGSSMWPHSSIDGIVAAINGRLPGVPVRIKFSRLVPVSPPRLDPSEIVDVDEIQLEFDTTVRSLSNPIMLGVGGKTHLLLLERCREVIRQQYGKVASNIGNEEIGGNSDNVFLAKRAAVKVLER